MGDKKIVIVQDISNKKYIGVQKSFSNDVVVLNDPLIIDEIMQKNGNSVNILTNTRPLLYAYDQNNISIKWVIHGEVTDDELINMYDKSLIKFRANRSGIQLPQNAINVTAG